MKILILEDSEERMNWFRKKLDGEIDHATKPDKAIEFLQSNEYDLILLDHDLEVYHYDYDVNCDKTTGLCVAKWLGENPTNNESAQIIIHSMNNNGAQRMFHALKREHARWLPFHILTVLVITKAV